ncbi:Maf family protein [Jeotgalibaca sp. MA1X17-3]|uniref:Maf family protein n=1 Tax=Jeotgalibaca sp. MA1X17-3 TaxID=2908211 RepID=UPI001F2BE294|nr:Maf family protein [Jeotgalibaca sp. MA1X17-3]UJF15641.1 Maf family protein [Jeotgalibaca sp. MA1X17-3]
MTKRIILASQSPRRKELLHLCVKEFSIQVADIEERAIESQVMEKTTHETFLEQATSLVKTLANEKAKVILQKNEDAIIIGADTIVVHENRVLGKPNNPEEAFEMLRSYAGKSHSVITGVSIQTDQQKENFSVETKVHFFDWNPQMEKEIRNYIASGSPFDKAGGYGIQEMPSLWISGIEGDYLNVVGLPVAYVNQTLQNFYK